MNHSACIDISSKGFADVIDITPRVEAALRESGPRKRRIVVQAVGQ